MCRNIKKLHHQDGKPSDEELRDAALQFIRKISGYRVPSQANAAVFERAVTEVTQASRRMFDGLIAGGSAQRKSA